jgi:Uma2 family endonuclease
MPATAHRPHIWTRSEYEQLIESGGFKPGARLELIEGEILDMAPQQSLHSTGVRLVEDALRVAFGSGFDVRSQLPLAIGDQSEPEPDIAVVAGVPRDYRDSHPSTALLVVEVADSSLEFDRTRKSAMYARNGIDDYWILNLLENVLEVYRNPQGVKYGECRTLDSSCCISPLHAASQSILILDLLP